MVTGVSGPWEFYQEGMSLQKIGFLIPQQIGPFDRMLEVVNGGGLVAAKAYDNIEQNLAWAASDWFLKAVISTGGGTPAYAPSPGTVQFRIQGYDAPAKLTVVFKAVQNQGFLGRYDLTVRKGNIGGFAIATTTGPAGETSGALSGAYTHTSAINCGQLFG